MSTPEDPSGASTTKQHIDCWGDPLIDDRPAVLDALAAQQRAWAEKPAATRGDSPLHWVGGLTAADVFWLAKRALAGPTGDATALAAAETRLRRNDALDSVLLDLSALHLEGADLRGAHLEQAPLIKAHLEHVDLEAAHLEGANLRGAQLQGAILSLTVLRDTQRKQGILGVPPYGAQLQGADLTGAHLEGATLVGADLAGAFLAGAYLQGAFLNVAHLEGADLTGAHLEGANLFGAHLEGKVYPTGDPDLARIRAWAPDFPEALQPTDLRKSVLDAGTALNNIALGDAKHGMVRVADLRWGGANLAVIDWTPLIDPEPQLGDERAALTWKPNSFMPPDDEQLSRQKLRAAHATHDQQQAADKLEAFRAAVRANRQLATALRDQGMNEEADAFAYRAQVLQRSVFAQQGKRFRALLWRFLDLIAGHGYKPQRSFFAYVIAILGFAVGFYVLGQFFGPAFSPDGAVVFSMTSFHGRGFFPGGISLEDPITKLAALEAFVGLVIEVSFIATFTQRFLAK